MISLAMHQWNLVCRMGSSVESATTVVSMDVWLQSVGVVVKHHAPTDACHTNRWHQDKISSKKRSKKSSFNLCKMLSVIYKVLWLGSFKLVKVPIVSYRLARDKLTGRKFMRMRREKTEELQKVAWTYERFGRGWLYVCVQSFLGSCALLYCLLQNVLLMQWCKYAKFQVTQVNAFWFVSTNIEVRVILY